MTSQISRAQQIFGSNGGSNNNARNALCHIKQVMHCRALGVVLASRSWKELPVDTRHSSMCFAELSHSSLTQVFLVSVSIG